MSVQSSGAPEIWQEMAQDGKDPGEHGPTITEVL